MTAGLGLLARRRSPPDAGLPTAAEPARRPRTDRHLRRQAGALRDFDWRCPAEGLVAIVGPNGAGKSTLIKAALGLVPRLSGEVRVRRGPLGQRAAGSPMCPQRTAVDWDFPTTALDVVAHGPLRRARLAPPASGGGTGTWRATASSRVGMADFADRQIGQLSGGQQQRVFLPARSPRTPSST